MQRHRQDFGPQPRAFARRAGLRAHERLEPVLRQLALRRVEQVLELMDQTLEGLASRRDRGGFGFFLFLDLRFFLVLGRAEFDGFVTRTLEEGSAETFRQVGERFVGRRVVVCG